MMQASQPTDSASNPLGQLSGKVKPLYNTLEALGGRNGSIPRHVLLGYSGGLDSTVLLHLLYQLQQAGSIQLSVAYYHHGWRGNPPPELPMMHKQCNTLGLSLILLNGNPNTPKTEASAREVRYNGLLKLANVLQADAIVTAHHADDQVETILFRLFRGTGLDGLKGIHPRWVPEMAGNTDIPVLRPLLDWTRQQLYDYATNQQLRWYEDPSNQDIQFSRNAIRQQLMPIMDQHFPTARLSLLRLSQTLGADADIVANAIDTLWETVYDPKHKALKRTRLTSLNIGYQRRLMKRYLDDYGLETTWSLIDRALQFVHKSGLKTSCQTGKPPLLSLPSPNPTEAITQRRFLSIYPVSSTNNGTTSVVTVVSLANKLLHSSRLLAPVLPAIPVFWPPASNTIETAPVTSTYSLKDELSLIDSEETLDKPDSNFNKESLEADDKPTIAPSPDPVTDKAAVPPSPPPKVPLTPIKSLVQVHIPRLLRTFSLTPVPIDQPLLTKAQLQTLDNDLNAMVWVDLTTLHERIKGLNEAKQLHTSKDSPLYRLVLRTRQPGDRFHPLGMQQSVLLKDFLIKRKLPHKARANRLLLVLEKSVAGTVVSPPEVMWIPGVEISDLLRILPKSETSGFLPTHCLSLTPMTLTTMLETIPAYNLSPPLDSQTETTKRHPKNRSTDKIQLDITEPAPHSAGLLEVDDQSIQWLDQDESDEIIDPADPALPL
jgi:tRNA(Ile)-lysidine synthetase-like protein